MSQEIPLRLALDNLRFMPDQTPEKLENKRKFLREMLRLVQKRKDDAIRAEQRRTGSLPIPQITTPTPQGQQGQGPSQPPTTKPPTK